MANAAKALQRVNFNKMNEVVWQNLYLQKPHIKREPVSFDKSEISVSGISSLFAAKACCSVVNDVFSRSDSFVKIFIFEKKVSKLLVKHQIRKPDFHL